MNDEEFKRKLQQEFLSEASELIEEIEDILSTIRDPDGFSQQVHILFRLVHTIKGSAYTACLESLGEFVHHVEHLLSEVREGNVTYDEDIIDVLLSSVDTIRDIVGCLQNNMTDLPDTTTLVKKINQFLGKDGLHASHKPNESKQTFGYFTDDDAEQSPKAWEIFEENVSQNTTVKSEQPDSGGEQPEFLRCLPTRELSEINILICDDDDKTGEALQDDLSFMDFKSHYCSNVEDAMKEFEKGIYNLVITDIKMSPYDGVEFVRRIRLKDKKIPVIAISGAQGFGELIALVELGIQDYIVKPWSSEELKFKVFKSVRQDIINKIVMKMTGSFFHSNLLIERIFSKLDCDAVYDKGLRSQLESEFATISEYVRAALKLNNSGF